MNLKDLFCLLRALHLMSPRQRRAFFDLATVQQLRIIEQACYNLLKNPRGLTPNQLRQAKKYSRSIKILARPQFSIDQKRGLLKQRGGFLGALLPLLGTIVSAVISR